jgi:hypothetical protein
VIDRTHRWGRRVLPLVLVVAGLVAQGDGAGAESRAGAHADTADKPAQVTPDPAFYTPPSPLPSGTPGTVIRSRPARAGWPSIQAIADAWTVMYLSTDAVDRPVAVTGTILVPKGGTPATRPIIGFGPGTQGPAFRCAPSIQIDAGGFYEQPAVNDMLKKGYAVAVPDYEGYHQNPTSTYMVGKSMGHALIDAVRAAQRFPAGGLSATTPVVFRGYSQGGGAAMWAGELKPSYAPEMNLVGVAGGGVPANLALVGLPLEGADGFGFFFYALLGLDNAYDELSLAPHLNDQGRTEVARMGTEVCALELILDYNGHRLGDYTATNPLTTPWFTRLNENVLGATAITVPVFQYHEPQDGLVAFGQAQTLRNDYCAKGVNHTWKTYDTQGASGIIRHLNLVYRANVDVNTFIEARIAGTPATSNCGT